jgi:hypothetical protein
VHKLRHTRHALRQTRQLLDPGKCQGWNRLIARSTSLPRNFRIVRSTSWQRNLYQGQKRVQLCACSDLLIVRSWSWKVLIVCKWNNLNLHA